MILELHMLQNFAPSCLNRDDTNSPKDCEFGGYRRARISSQCQKRAIRLHFQSNGLLHRDELADRSKRLILRAIVPELIERGRDESQAIAAVEALLSAVKLKAGGDHRTQYLLYLGRREVREFVELVDNHWESLTAKKTSKQKPNEVDVLANCRRAVEQILGPKGAKAADVALFGRMIADQVSFNVDAACQVAHAISTNRVAMELDYFTAVDDLQPAESDAGAGAGMIGTVEFNSSCFYRYANVDLRQLGDNLQDDVDLARRTVTAFIHAAIEAIPTGKQNTFAAHNPPDFVMAVVRECGQWNLANAFVEPARGDETHDLVAASAGKLATYWSNLARMFGLDDVEYAYVWRDNADLPGLNGTRKSSIADLVAMVEPKLVFAGREEVGS